MLIADVSLFSTTNPQENAGIHPSIHPHHRFIDRAYSKYSAFEHKGRFVLFSVDVTQACLDRQTALRITLDEPTKRSGPELAWP